jgi:3-dehydroquinate synthase
MKLETATGSTRIVVGESLKNLAEYAGGRRIVLLVDTNVGRLHGKLLSGYERVDIGCGEESKSLGRIEEICRRLLELGVDRSWLIVGVGGGVACDIAGFAASVFMRGVPFGFAPTSLLAQADASIGGKNGVNLDGYKNIVGVFNQPRFVLLDFEVLRTLPGREVRAGAAEIIKHALIGDPGMFQELEGSWRRLLALEEEVVEAAVGRSISLKAKIVRRDEREAGERRKLNFGHTLAHALEKTAGVSHGESVGMGMAFAARVSAARGLLAEAEEQRVTELLREVGLPVAMPAASKPLLEAVRKDKKREGDILHFVLLEGVGKAAVAELTLEELEGYIHDLR